jgi:hypothetical protein
MNPIAILPLLLAVVSLAACGGAGGEGADASTPTPVPRADTRQEGAAGGTPIRIAFGDTAIDARLLDTATARDLAAQLPLTLRLRDHNGAEKTAPLPRELSLDGAPRRHDPVAGDIGYFAPGGDFVLYYDDDAPYFDGIVRIGEFKGDPALVQQLPEGAGVTVERRGARP